MQAFPSVVTKLYILAAKNLLPPIKLFLHKFLGYCGCRHDFGIPKMVLKSHFFLAIAYSVLPTLMPPVFTKLNAFHQINNRVVTF